MFMKILSPKFHSDAMFQWVTKNLEWLKRSEIFRHLSEYQIEIMGPNQRPKSLTAETDFEAFAFG